MAMGVKVCAKGSDNSALFKATPPGPNPPAIKAVPSASMVVVNGSRAIFMLPPGTKAAGALTITVAVAVTDVPAVLVTVKV